MNVQALTLCGTPCMDLALYFLPFFGGVGVILRKLSFLPAYEVPTKFWVTLALLEQSDKYSGFIHEKTVIKDKSHKILWFNIENLSIQVISFWPLQSPFSASYMKICVVAMLALLTCKLFAWFIFIWIWWVWGDDPLKMLKMMFGRLLEFENIMIPSLGSREKGCYL